MPRSSRHPGAFTACLSLAALATLAPRVAAQDSRPPVLPGNPRAASAPKRPSDTAFLGVFTDPIPPASGRKGLRITWLYPGSSAEAIGLRTGDEIIALNDILIRERQAFIRELRREKVGATIRLLVRRGGEKVKLKGKIGGYRRTMTAIQEKVRAELADKPLPPLPPVLWWDGDKRSFSAGEDPRRTLAGKLGVIIAFDDCSSCRANRYGKFVLMARQLASGGAGGSLGFVGLYLSDSQDSERPGAAREHARKLFESLPPSFSVGIVRREGGPPPPAERMRHLYLYNHGLVIVDPSGKVRFTQIVGVPGREFALRYQELVRELAPRSGATGQRLPSPARGGTTPKP